MSDKLESPLLKPTDAAYQVVIELIRSGAFASHSIGASGRADNIIEVFDKLKLRFEQLKNERASSQ